MASFEDNWNQNAQEKRAQDWNNFWGGFGNNIGNFFNEAPGKIGEVFNPIFNNPTGREIENKFSRDYSPGGEKFNRLPQHIQSKAPQAPNPGGSLMNRMLGQGANSQSSLIPDDGMSDEEKELAASIAAIRNAINNRGDYREDPQVRALVDSAFGGALSAVGNARTRANENYNTSDDMLARLSAADVNAIQNEDLNAIRGSHTNLQAGYDKNLGAATTALQNDRNMEMQNRTEMLQRLGLQESGMGTAGETQTKAIADITADTAGAKNQASGYLSADEVRNTEAARAASQGGLNRRADLRRDLDNILGNLDDAEAQIGNSKSQALLAGLQADKESWNNAYKTDVDTLEMLLGQQREDKKLNAELQKIGAKASGSNGVLGVMQDRFRSQNIDPMQYLQAYSDVVGDNRFNSNSGHDKVASYVEEMMRKNPGLNKAKALEWVMGIENYGTDKLSAQ
jgi:hypothetical protein